MAVDESVKKEICPVTNIQVKRITTLQCLVL